ncbi:MAG: hypothetical protein ACKOWF_03530 [Chloroflexota bacterium]
MSGEARESDRAGEWIVPDVSYVDPQRLFCALCGRPIARRYWRVSGDPDGRAYCEIRHAGMDAERRRLSVPASAGSGPRGA